MKQLISFFFKLFVSIFLLSFILKRINFSEIISTILGVDPSYFLFGFIIFLLALLVNTKKWQLLLSHLNFNETLHSLLRLNLIGNFYGTFLPGGQLTGEVIKSYQISKDKNDKPRIVFSVVMDRLVSLIAFIFIGTVAFIIANPDISIYANVLYMFIFFVLISFFIISLFSERAFSLVNALHAYLLKKNGEYYLISILDRSIDTLFTYRGSFRLLFFALFWAFAFQLLNTLGLYFFSLAVGVNLQFIDLLWINTLVNIVIVMPVAIMGLGLREVSFIYLLSLFGISSVQSTSLSLLVFIVVLFTAILGGIIELYGVFVSRRK